MRLLTVLVRFPGVRVTAAKPLNLVIQHNPKGR